MNINFKIDNVDYRMTSDKYQVILNKVGTIATGENAGKESLTHIGYYKNELIALKDLVDVAPRTSEAETIDELIECRIQVLNDIDEVIKKYQIGVKL